MRLALLTTVLVLAAPAATAGGSTLPGYYGCSALFLKQHPHMAPGVRPHSITVACADGNFLFIHLRWASWAATVARASGTASLNDCTPYCAAGHFHSYPASVTLSQVRTCKNGVRVFTEISWRYTGAKPKAATRLGSERYSC